MIYDGLLPEVRQAAEAADAELDLLGIKHKSISGLRTDKEQWALWCQGRKDLAGVNETRAAVGWKPISAIENKYTVTRCDGYKVKSNHQGGRAIDKVPINDKGWPVWPGLSDQRWIKIAEIMKKHGFRWGGDWKDFPDYPHYEYRG
jgi:peptidoglycan LD-endopeptidase CwlK